MRSLLLMTCVILLSAGPAVSQRTANQAAAVARLQGEFQDEQVRAQRLRADANDAANDILALGHRLTALGRASGGDDARMAAQRARLRSLGDREAVIIGALAVEEGRQAHLLSALQMMSLKPPPALLVPADEAIDTARASILIRAALPPLRERARVLQARQAEIQRIRRLAALSSERLFTADSAETDHRAGLEAALAGRTAMVAVLQAEAAQAERAAQALRSRLLAMGATLPATDDDTLSRATRLPGGRSSLTPPVPGPPATRFGRATPGWGWSSRGGSVIAPASATVSYAGPLEGWGQVVVLDLGPGWRAIVSGLTATDVETGDRVGEGQVLGQAGGSTSLPIRFELRRDERLVDPAPWLE